MTPFTVLPNDYYIRNIEKNTTTIATCNFTACSSQRILCSDNHDCECFSLTTSPTVGICASAVLPCTSVVRCNADNKTCSVENTVCVNSTRCGQPVCYPLALANKLICPKNTTVATKTTTKITTTTAKIPTTTKKNTTSTTKSTSTVRSNTTIRSNNTIPVCGNRSKLLTFDDLSSDELIPNGYNGINWNNAYAILFNTFAVSGYSTGTVSGNLTTFNGGGTPMTMTGANGALFTLNSAAVASAWYDNLQLTVVGYRSDVVIRNNTFILQVFTVSYITFNGYSGLDTAVFSTSGGTINPTVFGGLGQYAMDNLCLSFP
ncbi:unnamed protein product [Adineta steineri]|uniref:Uncharacterized protein n=1 Tax=Adineta steineri TaxID=433720 RepID=A0A819RZC3_9BILA|nr:unnamed protein product [Adineta steineri]CAF0915832.1 unnamed protein product [Adineta steineri]CAF3995541.1 unnamed protein product [Adineta steineri]CAF4045233.1 unnamed protein product [Adineta steineri]